MNHSYADFFGSREHHMRSTWTPPTTCAVCGFKVADDYGFCWIHKVEYVVMTYKPGRIDALPIKQEIRRRMVSNDYSLRVMADVLGVDLRKFTRLLTPRNVWLTIPAADFWVTKLHIEVPEAMWAA